MEICKSTYNKFLLTAQQKAMALEKKDALEDVTRIVTKGGSKKDLERLAKLYQSDSQSNKVLTNVKKNFINGMGSLDNPSINSVSSPDSSFSMSASKGSPSRGSSSRGSSSRGSSSKKRQKLRSTTSKTQVNQEQDDAMANMKAMLDEDDEKADQQHRDMLFTIEESNRLTMRTITESNTATSAAIREGNINMCDAFNGMA